MRSGETPDPAELPELPVGGGPTTTPKSPYVAQLRETGIELDSDPVRPRVVVDSSVLLGSLRRYVAAAAHLGYVEGYWSSWIVAELVRKRTEWIGKKAVRDRCDVPELLRRQNASREKVNFLVDEFSRDIHSVDYRDAPDADLAWLADLDDWPVMQTALAARAEILVSDNKRDFPPGETRNGVRIMTAEGFLAWLYQTNPNAEADIKWYLGE